MFSPCVGLAIQLMPLIYQDQFLHPSQGQHGPNTRRYFKKNRILKVLVSDHVDAID